jgi:hypothetical protein
MLGNPDGDTDVIRPIFAAAAAAFALGALPATSRAEGSEFLRDCQLMATIIENYPARNGITDEQFNRASRCAEYLDGAAGQYRSLSIWREALPLLPICVPDTVSTAQLVLIVVKFLKENPDRLHFTKNGLVFEAYLGAFPCFPEASR